MEERERERGEMEERERGEMEERKCVGFVLLHCSSFLSRSSERASERSVLQNLVVNCFHPKLMNK